MIRGTLAPPKRVSKPRHDERRTHMRYRLSLPMNLRTKRWNPALLMDLSRGGLYLRTQARSPIGNRVRVTLRNHYSGVCQPRGMVVRALAMPIVGGFAVRFDQATDAFAELFDYAETLTPGERATFLASEIKPSIEVAVV